MLVAFTILVSQIAFGFASFAQYTPSSQLIKRSHHLVKRGDGSFSGRATFYATGLGACGNTNTDSDFIVALNAPQYNANKWCGKKIKISMGGKSTTATIQDECPGCPSGGLDMSPSLFEFFASKDVGIFYMKWSLEDVNSDNSPTPAPPSPSPTPPPPKTNGSPPQHKPSDQSSPSKVADSPPAYKQTDDPSGLQNHTGNTTPTNQKSTSTSPATQSNNPPYSSGGNLDAINQLVILFGSLTAASADIVLNNHNHS